MRATVYCEQQVCLISLSHVSRAWLKPLYHLTEYVWHLYFIPEKQSRHVIDDPVISSEL